MNNKNKEILLHSNGYQGNNLFVAMPLVKMPMIKKSSQNARERNARRKNNNPSGVKNRLFEEELNAAMIEWENNNKV